MTIVSKVMVPEFGLRKSYSKARCALLDSQHGCGAGKAQRQDKPCGSLAS